MERAKIGDVEISVVSSERLYNKALVTEKPVEKGENVVDHTKKQPITIELVGAIVGDDAGDKLNKLKKLQNEGTLIKYIHRNALSNMFIEDISSVHETKIRNGFEFNIRLKQIRIVQAKEVEIKISDPSPKANTQVKPETSSGLQQVQENPTTPFPPAPKVKLGGLLDTALELFLNNQRNTRNVASNKNYKDMPY